MILFQGKLRKRLARRLLQLEYEKERMTEERKQSGVISNSRVYSAMLLHEKEIQLLINEIKDLLK